jgi:glycosyltransferase involved in cell wall biosynthesis
MIAREDDAVVPLTVVVPTLNEEDNLPAALSSVSWAAEVIVVDSGSTDATQALARAAGARVVLFHYLPGGPKKKAWMLAHVGVATDWMLLLDADERVPEALRAEIAERIRGDSEHDGFYVDREFVFMGRSLRCFRPNWNLRLVRTGLGFVEDLGLAALPGTGDNEIHEHVRVHGSAGYLRSPLLHEDYRGLTEWLDRHNKYATWEAHLYARLRAEPVGVTPLTLLRLPPFERKRALRRVWVRLPGRPLLRFLVWYLGRRGFLDGREGLVFCLLMAHYEFIIGLKERELRTQTVGRA